MGEPGARGGWGLGEGVVIYYFWGGIGSDFEKCFLCRSDIND